MLTHIFFAFAQVVSGDLYAIFGFEAFFSTRQTTTSTTIIQIQIY
jgi:hypothetical protein